jgi:hypothetical protein
MQRTRAILAILVAAVAVIAVAVFVGRGPSTSAGSDICRGVPAELGGCDPDQPRYSGTTCAEIGREFGTQLNDRSLVIIAGEALVGGESRATRLLETRLLVAIRANERIRDLGIVKSCGVDEFMAAAEPEFSDALRSTAPAHLYDGVASSYPEWIAAVRDTVRIIDRDEDLPFEPTQS